MKQTDGLFHEVFNEIASEYPEIQNEHWIVDIGAAKLSDTPEAFDVIVMPNLYGDILSDVAAQIAGSVGLAGSANIGEECAMFEAIHGSAPRRAGQNMANPSGLIQASVLMLNHLGFQSTAEEIHNAWLKTLEEGYHTYDIFKEGVSKEKVGTKEFADIVIANLGLLPKQLKPVFFEEIAAFKLPKYQRKPRKQKELVGADFFMHWIGTETDNLAASIQSCLKDVAQLSMITNRGIKVWPEGFKETFCTDHWRCRILPIKDEHFDYQQIPRILLLLNECGFEVIKTENLYYFDNKPAFSMGQGQ